MTRNEEYWTQDQINAYGEAVTGTGTSGLGTGSIILGVLALIVCAALACGAPLGILGNKVKTDKAEADTKLAEAEALLVLADARAEAEVIRAEADAVLLLAYNDVATLALNSDIRRSHPELLLGDLLGQIFLAGLGLVACITVPAAVFLYTKDKKPPKEGASD